MIEVDEKLYLRHGSAGDGAFSLAVTPERAGWAYAGLRVRHPRLIAAVLYRDAARPRDDVTVLVARRRA